MTFHLGTRRLSGLLTVAILLVALGVGFVSPRLPAYAAAVWSDGMAAVKVLGQADFTSGTSSTTTASTLNIPWGVAVDPTSGKVFVLDTGNNRVLRFASQASLSNGANAEGVLGQADFTTVSAGASSTKMSGNVTGVAVGSDGTLWVADIGNNRVLRFASAASKPNGAAADGVLGQPDFTTVSAGASSTKMKYPYGVAVGSDGTLWVADSGNNRVLRFASAAGKANGDPADGVLGQANFTSNVGLPSASSTTINGTRGVAVDSNGTLWVADSISHRVLRFANAAGKLNGTPADGVLGQPNFTSNVGLPSASSTTINGTRGVAVDSNGTLWVTDGNNNRVLFFDPNPSSNANLSTLALSSGTLSPTFAAGTTTYTASVANSVNSLTVTPTVAEAHATVKVNGVTATSGSAATISGLIVGTNTITVEVTAQDPTITKTYTVTVTRNSNDANLSALAISQGTLSPSFATGTISYSASVANSVGTLTLTPTVNFPSATVTVSGTAVTSGSPSGAISLAVGANVIPVLVTAQDGTLQTYTVTVTRTASNNADPSALALSVGTLVPAFDVGTFVYTASVDNSVTSFTVSSSASEGHATITVNGHSADTPVVLAVGANTITIVVTAQDGTTTKTYTVTVTRASASASSNADLSGLTLSGVTLSPSFAVATTSYSATVANSVNSLTVTPTGSDANASITVNGSSAASAVHLSVGANRITIVVTAQDGTTKTYTVTVTRIGEADVEITQSYRLVKEPTKTGPLTTLAALTNTLSLTITVHNHGPDAVTGVVVTDSFPEAAVGTVWTWTCVGAGGGVCGNANGTGNLNETLGLLPKDGSVTFVVTGSLLNPNNWRNTPGLVTPTGVVNTFSGNSPVIVGHFLIFAPIVMR